MKTKICSQIVQKKLKNNLSLFAFSIFLVFSSSVLAQSGGIRFEKTKWKQVLEKAKKEKKLIFLDCYTSWCGPCKWMEQNIYNNDTVANFYNSNFICMKMEMEKGEGLDLAKKYNISTYPTMLYINSAAEVLHRTCGAGTLINFIEDGQNALNPQKQLVALTKLYNENSKDSRIAYLYFELMESACLPFKTEVLNYFATQKDINLISIYNWKLLYRYSEFTSKSFQYLESNRAIFSKLYNQDSVERKINLVYANMLQQVSQSRNIRKFDILKVKFRKLKTKEAEKIIQQAELKLVKFSNSDLKNAIEIQDSIFGPTNVSEGFGKVLDYRYEPVEPYNTAWFKLNIDHDTILTFDIVPFDSLNDYDFAVFKVLASNSSKEKSSKNNVKSTKGKLVPERLCYSYCTSKSGVTGLSKYSSDTIIGAGLGPAYASGIHVKAGESYYLMVNFPYKTTKPLGFTIYFYNYWPKRRPIVLNNVFFENNKSVLPKESFSELDKLAVRLQKNQMKIEIRGHADGKGDELKNQKLSEERAKSVVDYLISKNIKPDRLFYKGAGSSKPVASDETEEGRQKNRRVEFVVVMN